MRAFRKICAWLLGSVFFIAGFLKLMDPVGAGLVVEEYYRFFNFGFLASTSYLMGLSLALLETFLGAAVITGVWRGGVAVASGLVMVFFTGLTLVLWIVNPAMDCGCFGEAVHLTHFQSLLKNIVLLFLWCGAYIPFRSLLPTPGIKYAGFSLALVSVTLFTLWSVKSVPVMDFTPMAPGEEFLRPEEEFAAEGAPVLSFYDMNGEYADSLALTGNVLVASVYNPEMVSARSWERLSSFAERSSEEGLEVLLLVASTPDDMQEILQRQPQLPEVYFADRRTLMTLNRSNGGVTFVDDGFIVRKWAHRSLPDRETLSALMSADPTEAMLEANNPGRLRIQGFLLYVFAVMLLL